MNFSPNSTVNKYRTVRLEQGSPNYGLRAGRGPLNESQRISLLNDGKQPKNTCKIQVEVGLVIFKKCRITVYGQHSFYRVNKCTCSQTRGPPRAFDILFCNNVSRLRVGLEDGGRVRWKFSVADRNGSSGRTRNSGTAKSENRRFYLISFRFVRSTGRTHNAVLLIRPVPDTRRSFWLAYTSRETNEIRFTCRFVVRFSRTIEWCT